MGDKFHNFKNWAWDNNQHKGWTIGGTVGALALIGVAIYLREPITNKFKVTWNNISNSFIKQRKDAASSPKYFDKDTPYEKVLEEHTTREQLVDYQIKNNISYTDPSVTYKTAQSATHGKKLLASLKKPLS